MTFIIAFITMHLSWFAVAGSVIAAFIAGHVHGTAKSASKVALANTVAKDAQADAAQAKQETVAVKNAATADATAAAIPETQLDLEGKARGIVRD